MRQRWNGGCRSAQAEGYGGLAARTFGARRLADVSFGGLGQREASGRQRAIQPGAEWRQRRARSMAHPCHLGDGQKTPKSHSMTTTLRRRVTT